MKPIEGKYLTVETHYKEHTILTEWVIPDDWRTNPTLDPLLCLLWLVGWNLPKDPTPENFYELEATAGFQILQELYTTLQWMPC
jgi:hypothetical protein